MDKETTDSLLVRLAQAIYDKKGLNILLLDVRGVSSMTDYFLIAEGRVGRHVQALSDAVIELLKGAGLRPSHVEGVETGEWIVVDCFQIVIHLFGPDLRSKYQLEQVWKAGKVVDLPLERS